MEMLSQHRSSTTALLGATGREQTVKASNNEIGPGSFKIPLSMERQIESNKRNVVHISSLGSPLQRDTPEKHAKLGMREGPGPAKYVSARYPEAPTQHSAAGPSIGPGFHSFNEPHISGKCARLIPSWKAWDRQLKAEHDKLDREMRRIQQEERRVMIMARGLREIAKQNAQARQLRSGIDKRKQNDKTKAKKKKQTVADPVPSDSAAHA